MAEDAVEALAEALVICGLSSIDDAPLATVLDTELRARGYRLVPAGGPGGPMARLDAVSDYTVKAGIATGFEARAPEDILIEDHKRLRAMLDAAPGAKEEGEGSPNG